MKKKTDTELKRKVDEINKKSPVVSFDPSKPLYTPPSVWKIALNWLFFALVIVGIYLGWKYVHIELPVMPWYLVLLFALSLSFTWVEVMHWGSVKPFNCVKCLTGWFALILAIGFHTPFWYFFLFAGLLVGALFDAIKSRL